MQNTARKNNSTLQELPPVFNTSASIDTKMNEYVSIKPTINNRDNNKSRNDKGMY